MTLLQLQKRRDDALKALLSADGEKAKTKAAAAYSAAEQALATFKSTLESKTVKKTKKEETYEEEDEDEEEDASDEEEDDEPKKPVADDSDDDDGDDDDSDDSDDSDEDEDEDADEDEDEEEDEDEDEKARASALSSARSLLKLARKGGDKSLAAAAKASLRSLKSAMKPKALERYRALRAACSRVTGKKSTRAIVGALDALAATAKSTEKLSADVSRIKAANRRTKVDAALAEAKRDGKVTKAEIAALRTQGLKDPKWLKGYLSLLPKKVRGLEEALVGQTPENQHEGQGRASRASVVLDAQNLTAEQRKAIEQAATNAGKSFDDFVADMNTTAAKANGRAPLRHEP
jgi:hypothetical protein